MGCFQGGIQALSRSYLAKLVPADRSAEYFGLMDICGKGASFVGTTMIANDLRAWLKGDRPKKCVVYK